jgi:hypothetical protein
MPACSTNSFAAALACAVVADGALVAVSCAIEAPPVAHNSAASRTSDLFMMPSCFDNGVVPHAPGLDKGTHGLHVPVPC